MRSRKASLLTVLAVILPGSLLLADDVIRINFQEAGHPKPLRTGIVHLEDIGEVYGDRGNGYEYGWNNDETDEGRRRYGIGDCRLDGHVRGNGSVWEIALADGDYLVNIALGDPDNAGNFSFGLEGASFVDPNSNNYFYIVEDIAVTVNDGKLTLSDTTGELKVCYIEIVDAAIGFPAIQTYPAEDPSMPAFPTAEGAARHLTGGRGGDVYHVTTLDWTGPGSLQWGCLTTYEKHPRTIVFDVSGYIGCSNPGTRGQVGSNGCSGADGDLNLNGYNITIAGQTAPGKGITIRDHTTSIANSGNIVMRYLRMRLGDENKGSSTGADCITPEYVDGLMLDHLSVSWGVDGEMDSRNLNAHTTQWCIFAEPLNDSIHYKGTPHGYLMSWREHDGDYSIHHNLFSSGTNRHPSIGATTNGGYIIDFINNINYNWHGNMRVQFENWNFINNYFKYGPSTFGKYENINVEETLPNPWCYLAGNVFSSVDSGDIANCAAFTADNYLTLEYVTSGVTRSDFEAFSEFDHGEYTPVTDSAADGYQRVLDYVGCSLVRDDADINQINNVINSTAYMGGYEPGIIDSQNDVGGWPDLPELTRSAGFDTDQDGMPDAWETARGLNASDPDDRNDDDDSDGYTNLEEYLNELAGDVEPPENDPPVWTVDPVNKADAIESKVYVGTLAGGATDPDVGDILTFTKVSGPDWLTIDPNGALSGTPAESDIGSNSWTVSVTDSLSTPVTATLNIDVLDLHNGFYGLDDFRYLASAWLDTGCGYCQGADLDFDNDVDESDLLIFAAGWLPRFVPDVVGSQQSAATTTITGLGLTVGTVTVVTHPTIPEGEVISQDPSGGTLLFGSAIDIVVSDGPIVIVILEQNNNQDDKVDVKDGQDGAQSFEHGNDFMVTSVELKLSRESTSPNDDLHFAIGTSINGGTVAGTAYDITPSSVTDTSDGSSFMDYTITFASPVGPLNGGATYYLNVETGGNGKAYFLGYNGNSDYGDGDYFKNGSGQGKDVYFKISGYDN